MSRNKQIVNVANSGTVAAVVGIVAVVAMTLSLILAIVAMVMVALLITAAISTAALVALAAFRYAQYRVEAEAALFMWRHQLRTAIATPDTSEELRIALRDELEAPPKPAVALAIRRLQSRPAALPSQVSNPMVPLTSRVRSTSPW